MKHCPMCNKEMEDLIDRAFRCSHCNIYHHQNTVKDVRKYVDILIYGEREFALSFNRLVIGKGDEEIISYFLFGNMAYTPEQFARLVKLKVFL
jgi:hypothetical protein